ncbi:MAG TPA: BsuPI-related putative proteinase inhibitor [Chthoniobacterales bacterium]|jgi:hypothetical protein
MAIATTNPIVYPNGMHARLSVLAVLVLSLAACSTNSKPAESRPPAARGLAWRILHPFARNDTPAPASPTETAFTPAPKRSLASRILRPFARDGAASAPRKRGLQVTVQPDSATPSLRAISQLGVRVLVTNYTKNLVSLTFPTSQRIEIIGRTADGKIFHTYSTDRSFTQEVSVLTINPGEHLEYVATVPTRSMVAGNTYLISASIVGHTGMEGTASITPIP